MKFYKRLLSIAIIFFFQQFSAQELQNQEINTHREKQAEIIEKYVYNCADNLPINSPQYQICLDRGLVQDSTVAYLWQQKAMPYFKMMKYEVGMEFINKAVKYDRQKWLPYRAFIKCVFAKTYREAIVDFEDAIAEFGNMYEMDHTYNFYIGLSYLQLNEFEKAEQIFKEDIATQVENNWVHHLDLFYYGISKFEQEKWKEAIEEFDRALELYPEFSDAQYYKAVSLARLGYIETADALFKIADVNRGSGYTINEGNSKYEKYPYQIR